MAAFTNNIMDDKTILELADSAKQAREEYDQKKEAVEQKMFEWLKKRMPVGTVINTKGVPNSDNPRPSYLQNVSIMKGNARGTGLFRIEKIRDVEFNSSHTDMSRWNCDATPISEKTGKDMSAAPGNRRCSAEFVTLRGYIGSID